MKCVMPDVISKIDEYAEKELNIPTDVLISRAGEAVFSEALSMLGEEKKHVLVLSGCGNNAGDGYCAACLLSDAGFSVTALDVFGVAMRTPQSKLYYEKFKEVGKIILMDTLDEGSLTALVSASDLIIDAILGTGARRELSPELSRLADIVNHSGAYVLAVDVPLGVDASDGTLSEKYIQAHKTVTLSYPKIGLFSYPARAVCSEIVNYGIGINNPEIDEKFNIRDFVIDDETVKSILPKRDKNSHKGTHGRLLAVCGSDKYRGAAALACHSALRTGVGIVELVSEREVCDACCVTMPEVIYSPMSISSGTDKILKKLDKASALLVGCGCGVSKELYIFVCNLLNTDGCPVVLDADALNALSEYGTEVLRTSKRSVIITPHPTEMARLCKTTTENIQSDRMNYARSLSREYGIVTVLKGASTIITDGDRVCIDITGTPALAKGGSGDVLAGAVASFVAQGMDEFFASSLAVYLHSRAGCVCAREYSEYGVRPSDLPVAIARVLAEIANS